MIIDTIEHQPAIHDSRGRFRGVLDFAVRGKISRSVDLFLRRDAVMVYLRQQTLALSLGVMHCADAEAVLPQ